MSGIIFQVETQRVLQLLTREIYDSPLALLRENVQNAYDAVRMRFAPSGTLTDGGRIDVHLDGDRLSVTDNGIGMTEEVLRNNFWKAGSSGKRSEAAHRSGVVGTFGIGALANFGVCISLTVESRAANSIDVFRSSAAVASLEIGKECISFERIASTREIGTSVSAILAPAHRISANAAKAYLEPYVALLPVPVYLNGTLISQADFRSRLPLAGRTFTPIGSRSCDDKICAGDFYVESDSNGQVLVTATRITLGGVLMGGSMMLLQAGGQLMGLRSRFGLAPAPIPGHFQFGGFVDLSFLQPTAGREALSRESIEQVARLVRLAELAASECLSSTLGADKNNSFLLWIIANGRYDLSGRVSILLLPENKDVDLADIASRTEGRPVHYYTGTDPTIIKTFANEQAALLQVAQASPRRKVQLQYIQQKLKIPEIPNSAQVTAVYKGSDLSVAEASVLVRTAAVLRDDYLIPDVEVALADISHSVTVFPVDKNGQLHVLYIARASALIQPLIECHAKAYSVFGEFIKDFVRVSVYPRIQQYVPSSTRGGVDALRKLLQRNRELYRYEEADLGDLDGLLGEYLRDSVSLGQVLKSARSGAVVQTQRVSREQVGTVESELADVVRSPTVQPASAGDEYEPRPPISREAVVSVLKILTTAEKHSQLNNFTMLLGLSDRLMQREAAFFRTPHSTRILWGGQRVIYIFTDATARLSIYYDIEFKAPIAKTGGGMFPTTTLITKNRIFVPVPDALVDEFRIETGLPKEFFVRFDLLSVEGP